MQEARVRSSRHPLPSRARRRNEITSLAVMLALVSCSGGGGSGGGALEPVTAPSTADVEHFLARAAFGNDESAEQAIGAQGYAAHLDAMLKLPVPGASQWDKDARELLKNGSKSPPNEYDYPSSAQLTRWWLHLMLESEHPFQEAVAMFWHGHFAASTSVLGQAHRRWFVDHINLFREHGTGNFRDLLVKISRDWTMLRWLDGKDSTKSKPNENFAREFFELFTLGVDNGYTQEDIVEAARAFTGYRERFDSSLGLTRIEWDASRHDDGHKLLFGRVIRGQNLGDDFESVVDVTLDERGEQVARFITSKIWSWLVGGDPSAEISAELVKTFRESSWELAPVFKRVLMSRAFFLAKRSTVRSPVETSIGFLRATGLRMPLSRLETQLRQMGQLPTQPPDVNGWPGGKRWLSAQAMVEHANLLRFSITERSHQQNSGFLSTSLVPSADASADQVVAHWVGRLRLDVSEEERASFVDFLNSVRDSGGAVTSDEFDASESRHLDERVRGLLYVLGQHPSFLTR